MLRRKYPQRGQVASFRTNPSHRWFTIPAPVPHGPGERTRRRAQQSAGPCAGRAPAPASATSRFPGTWPPPRYLVKHRYLAPAQVPVPLVLRARTLLCLYGQPPVLSPFSFLIAAALMPGAPGVRAGSCEIGGYARHWPVPGAPGAAGRGNANGETAARATPPGNGTRRNGGGQRYPAQRRRERRSGERQPGNDGRARPAQRSGSGSGCVCSTVSRDTARVSAT